MYKIIILPLARKDIRNSADWYEQQKKGLGKRFTAHVRKIVSLIQQNPASFNIKFDDVRIAVLSIFPYLILYRIDESNQSIEIYAVYHTSQNPNNWEGR